MSKTTNNTDTTSTAIPSKGLHELIAELDFKIARSPSYPDLRNQRGLALAYQGDLEAASDDLAEALRLNPNYQAALVNLAWLHVQRDDRAAFRALLEGDTAERLPAERRLHLEFLGALHWHGVAGALGVLESPSASTADSWLSLDRLWALVGAAEWQAVDAHLTRMISANSPLDGHFRALGALQKAGVRRPGLQAWSSVYRGNPNLATLLRNWARVCNQAARRKEGETLLHWSVVVSLDVCSYWLEIGTQLDLEGREEEAEAALQRAQRYDSARVEPTVQLGILYASSGRPEDAILELEKAAAVRPRYVDVRYLLGLLYEEVGRSVEAIAEYRGALDVNPKYTPAMLSLGTLLEAQRHDREAVELLESVRSAGVSSVDLENRMARVYERMGQVAAAQAARARAEMLAQESS